MSIRNERDARTQLSREKYFSLRPEAAGALDLGAGDSAGRGAGILGSLGGGHAPR